MQCTRSYPGHDQSDVPSKKSEAKTYKKAILSFDEGEEFDTPISTLLLPKKNFKHTQQPQQLVVSSSHPATRPTTTTTTTTAQVISNNNNNTLYPSSYAVPTQPLTFSMSQISNKLIHSIHNDNKKSSDSSESSSRSSSTDSSSRGKKKKSKKVKKSKNKKEKKS